MLFLLLTALAALVSFMICVLAIYRSDRQKSVYFNLLSIAIALYLTGNFLDFSSATEASVVGVKVSYLGVPFIPGLWYLCVREFCGVKVERLGIVFGIMLVPFIIMVLAFTWEQNGLLFTGFTFQASNYISQAVFQKGPFYPVKQLYLYFFNALGLFTIVTHYIKGTRRFKKQAIFFFISALIPLFTTATWVVNSGDTWVDITPLCLAVAQVLFFWGLQKHGIYNVASSLRDDVVEHLQEGVLLLDNEGVYMDSNMAFKALFPQASEVPLGTELDEMSYLPFNFSTLTSEVGVREFTMDFEDCIRTYKVSVSPISRGGKLVGHSAILYNITPLKNIMSALEVKAHIDPLTTVYNRGYFYEKGQYEVQKSLLAKNALGAVFVDLDFFKKINDTYGHDCGDYVLRTVALVISGNLRNTDILARYGGEEFCILLLNTQSQGALRKAEDLRKKIEAHSFEYNGSRIRVTASLGLSMLQLNDDTDNLDKLLKRADEKLYEAKRGGRNRVMV